MDSLRHSPRRVSRYSRVSKLLIVVFLIFTLISQIQGAFTMAAGSSGDESQGTMCVADEDNPEDGTCFPVIDWNPDTKSFDRMPQAPKAKPVSTVFPDYDEEVATVADDFSDIRIAELEECLRELDPDDKLTGNVGKRLCRDTAFANIDELLAKRGVKELGYGGVGSVNDGADPLKIGKGGEWARMGRMPDTNAPFMFSKVGTRDGTTSHRRTSDASTCRWNNEYTQTTQKAYGI